MKSLAVVIICVGLACTAFGGYWAYSNYSSRIEKDQSEALAKTDVLPLSVAYDGIHATTISYRKLSITVDSAPSPDGDGRVAFVTGVYSGTQAFSLGFDQESLMGFVRQTPRADVGIVRLDPTTSLPQVVMTQYSGGAHCCILTKIATADASENWRVVDAGALDGDGGYQFQDLDGDGGNEFISLDNSFLYAFDCYACSYAPTRIGRLIGAEIGNVTADPKYRDFLRQKLEQMEMNARSNSALLHSNGYLGGWVAAKALVGELEDAWRTMLANYNRTSNWTMEECLVATPLNKCPAGSKRRLDFPGALIKHLVDNGYITLEQKRRLTSSLGAQSQPGNRAASTSNQPPPVQGLVPRTTEQPSFNCADAKSASARLICADATLAQLDNQLGLAFQERKSALPASEQQTLVREQINWIRERNIRCGLADKNTAPIEMLAAVKPCMAEAIQQRIAGLSAMGSGSNLSPQNGNPSAINSEKSYYVANANPPDAFLSLRTEPSTVAGFRLAQMPNGTELKVLIQRSDRWWRVRVVSTGQEGWALSGQGPSTWIECCRDPALH